MNRVAILPYNMGSRGSRVLSEELQNRLDQRVMRVYPNRRYQTRSTDVLLNWGWRGDTTFDVGNAGVVLNHPSHVRWATDKLRCLSQLKANGVATPDFTVEENIANAWIVEGNIVVERHQLRGHSGDGIELRVGEAVKSAPLYTKYQKKTHEYRVHVLPDGTTQLNQKRRNRQVRDEDVNWQVRNVAGGFIYCRNNVEHNQAVVNLGKAAVRACQLDFGAVDVLYHEPSGTAVVLEINTSPGLEGEMVNIYAESVQKFINTL